MADFRSAGNVPLGGAGKKQVKLYILFILDTLFLTELDRQQTLALNKREKTDYIQHYLALSVTIRLKNNPVVSKRKVHFKLR